MGFWERAEVGAVAAGDEVDAGLAVVNWWLTAGFISSFR
jgi:hypothetical protein